MATTFNCPSCGAPLETDGQETTIHCEYCGESVIVPQELRNNVQSSAGPGHIPMGSEQPGPAGNTTNTLPVAQIRQMMMAVRSGQIDEAVRIFQAGTGANPETASQTIDMIARQIAQSNRILPAELAAMLMGTYNAQTQGNYNNYQPAPYVRPRRRRGGLGCILALLIVILGIYFSYTALSPGQFIAAFSSGNQNTSLHETAVAPMSMFSTAIAPIMGKSSGGSK